jgi:hypothetical protein
VTRATRADGRITFCANSSTKESQHYPPAFGTAVSRLFRENSLTLGTDFASLRLRVAESSSHFDGNVFLALLQVPLPAGKEGWKDAALASVLDLLQ